MLEKNSHKTYRRLVPIWCILGETVEANELYPSFEDEKKKKKKKKNSSIHVAEVSKFLKNWLYEKHDIDFVKE